MSVLQSFLDHILQELLDAAKFWYDYILNEHRKHQWAYALANDVNLLYHIYEGRQCDFHLNDKQTNLLEMYEKEKTEWPYMVFTATKLGMTLLAQAHDNLYKYGYQLMKEMQSHQIWTTKIICSYFQHFHGYEIDNRESKFVLQTLTGQLKINMQSVKPIAANVKVCPTKLEYSQEDLQGDIRYDNIFLDDSLIEQIENDDELQHDFQKKLFQTHKKVYSNIKVFIEKGNSDHNIRYDEHSRTLSIPTDGK